MSPKTVFITGASSGIGLATALTFHNEGWNVVASMRSPHKAPTELTSLDASRLLITKCDVTNISTIESALAATFEKFGKVDWLVNNAGFGLIGIFEALPREKVLEEVNTNFIGLMDVTRIFLPHLRHSASSSEKGTVGVINITSGGGIWTLPHSSLYCASKFAVEGFTESLTYELASQNVYAKLVVPHGGITNTSFNDRSMQEYMQGQGTDEVKEAYAPFLKKASAAFGRMVANAKTSSEQVGRTIFEAASDGTDRLRYFIGEDSKGFLEAKFGEKGIKADEEYIASMRKYFDY